MTALHRLTLRGCLAAIFLAGCGESNHLLWTWWCEMSATVCEGGVVTTHEPINSDVGISDSTGELRMTFYGSSRFGCHTRLVDYVEIPTADGHQAATAGVSAASCSAPEPLPIDFTLAGGQLDFDLGRRVSYPLVLDLLYESDADGEPCGRITAESAETYWECFGSPE